MVQDVTNESPTPSQINQALDTRLTYFDLLIAVLVQHEKKLDDLIRKLSNIYESHSMIRDFKNVENHGVPLTCIVQA